MLASGMASRWAKRLPRQPRARFTFEVILEAAHQLLDQERALNTGAIARRAGVSVGSVYDYFSDKWAVLGELGERVLVANVEAAEKDFLWLSRRPEASAQLIRKFVERAARRRRSPVVRRLLKMAGETGHGDFKRMHLNRVEAILGRVLRAHPTVEAPPPAGVALLTRAIAAALEHAADETRWLDDPDGFEHVVEELTLLAHAYITVDRAAWLPVVRGERASPHPSADAEACVATQSAATDVAADAQATCGPGRPSS